MMATMGKKKQKTQDEHGRVWTYRPLAAVVEAIERYQAGQIPPLRLDKSKFIDLAVREFLRNHGQRLADEPHPEASTERDD